MTRLRQRFVLRQDLPGAVAIVVGAALLRVSLLSSVYQRYVRVGARPLLIASGIILIGLGVVGLVRSFRGSPSRGHAHVPAAALLLLVPVIGIFAVSPPALGSYAASRAEQKVLAKELKPATDLPPAVDGVVPLTLEDFEERTSVAQNLTVGKYGLIGFVANDPDGQNGEFYLTRITIVCCAADAVTDQIAVSGIADPPPRDTWVRVIGAETVVDGHAQIAADSLQRIKPPRDPYGR